MPVTNPKDTGQEKKSVISATWLSGFPTQDSLRLEFFSQSLTNF